MTSAVPALDRSDPEGGRSGGADAGPPGPAVERGRPSRGDGDARVCWICGSGLAAGEVSALVATVRAMTRSRSRCAASTSLTVNEVQALEELPDPAHELELAVACELEAGHTGRHAALCQTSVAPDVDWWLRWSEGLGRDLEPLQPCEAELGDDDAQDADSSASADDGAEVEEVCELAVDHAGAHSFQLAGTPGGRTPSPAYREKLEALMRSLP